MAFNPLRAITGHRHYRRFQSGIEPLRPLPTDLMATLRSSMRPVTDKLPIGESTARESLLQIVEGTQGLIAATQGRVSQKASQARDMYHKLSGEKFKRVRRLETSEFLALCQRAAALSVVTPDASEVSDPQKLAARLASIRTFRGILVLPRHTVNLHNAHRRALSVLRNDSVVRKVHYHRGWIDIYRPELPESLIASLSAPAPLEVKLIHYIR